MPRGIEIGKQKIRMNYYIELNFLLFGNKVTQGSLNIVNSLALPIDIIVKIRIM